MLIIPIIFTSLCIYNIILLPFRQYFSKNT
uniref:Uncharacterized protein n=1 Tax=Myoviridae sp. ctaNG1 TaxID=2825132 RepID=A0A8S5PAG4_9CAUD|nr:MAG TPA: hypothetical protein [Myoviridae sp. ctaNG1]